MSQFPGEKEMLILPLSNFEVFDMHREGNINIYECGLNLNLNSKSLEDLLETRKLSVLDFGQCLWNEARLVLYSNASFADLLPPSASEEAFLGNIMEKDQEYFHDIHRFYLSMTDLFYRCCPSIASVLLRQNQIIGDLFVLRPVFPLLCLSLFPSLLVSCAFSNIFPLRYTSSSVTHVGVSADERVLIQVYAHIHINTHTHTHTHRHIHTHTHTHTQKDGER